MNTRVLIAGLAVVGALGFSSAAEANEPNLYLTQENNVHIINKGVSDFAISTLRVGSTFGDNFYAEVGGGVAYTADALDPVIAGEVGVQGVITDGLIFGASVEPIYFTESDTLDVKIETKVIFDI